jgi:hypothetical protein
LFDWTREWFRDQEVKALNQVQHPADAYEAGQLRGYPARFQPLNCALRNPGLPGQLGLGQVQIQPGSGQSPAQFGEHSGIGGLSGYFHNAPNMALKDFKVN